MPQRGTNIRYYEKIIQIFLLIFNPTFFFKKISEMSKKKNQLLKTNRFYYFFIARVFLSQKSYKTSMSIGFEDFGINVRALNL